MNDLTNLLITLATSHPLHLCLSFLILLIAILALLWLIARYFTRLPKRHQKSLLQLIRALRGNQP